LKKQATLVDPARKRGGLLYTGPGTTLDTGFQVRPFPVASSRPTPPVPYKAKSKDVIENKTKKNSINNTIKTHSLKKLQKVFTESRMAHRYQLTLSYWLTV